MHILVIGYGSIGARHSRIAASLGMDVACVSANADCPHRRFARVADAIADFAPDRVVIANPTAKHAATLSELATAGFSGGVLIEKPVYSRHDEQPEISNMRAYVAYNLRFHPLVQLLRERIAARTALYSASFTAGQYLPQWRPASDYRQSYSARVEEGGGVLRDLSHELDLALWLCGPVQRVTAIGGHFSDLEIQSDDVFSLLSANDRCPSVMVSINYLDRMPHRSIIVNGPGLTAALDLVRGSLDINGETIQLTVERDHTYIAQLQAFVHDDASTLCTLSQGIDVVRLVDAAEQAAASGVWITL
ncbi:Gfo/Idh/MocA family oxidoreductase [Caballeronia sp. GAWG1-5s-s]|uniref:Gfo/Idh/MocA family protein n=1 Tax=Caballeronia sp. GAWG1-5s-s TaxID=2921743 RepID=UPI00202975F7|nr:Gfo/Idh/MocA family oxidoreductase [Caballeronia sp. GAWG1-5s-s]